jgi:hypothetical protein
MYRTLEEHPLRLHRSDSRATYCSNRRLVASVDMFIRLFHSIILAWKAWVQHMHYFLVQVWHVLIPLGKFVFISSLFRLLSVCFLIN